MKSAPGNEKMTIIDESLLDRLAAEARESRRLRKNFNLHRSYEDPCQRLLNAIEPGTYIRPHRHVDPPKDEAFLTLRGRMAAILFHDDGRIARIVFLSPAGGNIGVDIPAGVWHSILSLESGSVFFECKPGPYQPISDKDWAPWAPPEGNPEAWAYLKMLEREVLER